MTIQSGFVPETTTGPCTDSYQVVDTDYPTKTVYVTREVFEPAAPAYYTVIPNSQCSKGSSSTFLTAPIHANADGSFKDLPALEKDRTVQTGYDKGKEVTLYADLAIKSGLTYEEYLKAVDQLQAIESGVHHVDKDGSVISGTVTTANEETFYVSDTKDAYVGETSAGDGKMRPLVVDIEKSLRATPIDPATNKPFPAPESKEGFVPLGGDKGAGATTDLDDGDSTRFREAAEVASNRDWIKTNPDPSKPVPNKPERDLINKYWTPAEGGFAKTNADRAAVNNDTVLVSPTGDATTPKDSEVIVRSDPR